MTDEQTIEDDPYIMYVIVKQGSREGTSLTAVLDDYNLCMRKMMEIGHNPDTEVSIQERFHEYFNQNIRKIVKRAKPKEWEQMTTDAFLKDKVLSNSDESSVVAITVPLRRSETPPVIKKMQVQGLVLNRDTSPDPNAEFIVYTDTSLGMSDGKLLAQIGHVIQLDWLKNGGAATVHLVEVAGSLTLPEGDSSLVSINDAGFTEIPSGSLTAYGVRVN